MIAIGAATVRTKGADEYAVAELKNDVICSGLPKVFVRSDNEPGILALTESAVTALKLAGVNVRAEESALYDSQRNALAESAVRRREATEQVVLTFLNSVSARPWNGPKKVRDVRVVLP